MVLLGNRLNAEVVFVADGMLAYDALKGWPVKCVSVVSLGYLESTLEYGVQNCDGEYILRLDDDEACSPAMASWLEAKAYEADAHWKFPRMHLWGDTHSVLLTPQLFPDHQTRLSTKAMSGGRHFPHAMSPFGGGALAPVAIEHHKFLVRSREERERTAAKWHQGGMRVFSLPEDVVTEGQLVDKGNGSVPWQPSWSKPFAPLTSTAG